MTTIHYIAAAYAVVSLVLMMTRKYRLKLILLIPVICQIGTVFLLNFTGFNISMTVAAVIINLLILLAADVFEKKQMRKADSALAGEGDFNREVASQHQSSFRPEESVYSGRDRSNPYGTADWTGGVTGELPDIGNLDESIETELKSPQLENKPINEVAPVQQEIFDASNNEIKEMIAKMLENGDIADAKRYLRMLAFFAKDESSRKMAEEKLAEINAMAQ